MMRTPIAPVISRTAAAARPRDHTHTHSTWRQLDAWVSVLGVEPMTAIRAATYWPSVVEVVVKRGIRYK